MEIDPNDPERGVNEFPVEQKKTLEETESQDFVELLKGAGSPLSSKELQDLFNELVKNLLADIAKAKSQYSSIQGDYKKTLAQLAPSSRSDIKNLKMTYLEQLNNAIKNLREKMEKTVSLLLPSTQIKEHEPSDELVHQVLERIKDPTIKDAYKARFIKDPETPFLSTPKKEASFKSIIKKTYAQMNQLETVSQYTSTIAADSEAGSMLTTNQETANLASNQTVKSAIEQACAQYKIDLGNYQSKTITFAQLKSDYDTLFSGLTSTVKSAIANDTSGAILPIKNDYDSSHTAEYTAHLQILIELVQNNLKIPAYQCLLPPNTTYPNLLPNGDFSNGTTGWAVSSGSGTMQVNNPGTYDKTSPVYNKNSLSFTHVPTKPGYVSVSQTITTIPGHIYLVSGYVQGTPPDKSDQPYAGGFSVTGARSFTSSTTGNNIAFPQNSNEIDSAGFHRRYFWVRATGNPMKMSLNGGAQTVFKNMSIIDLSQANVKESDALEFANTICPPVTTTGNPEVGQFPQVEEKLPDEANLLDGKISIQKNIDQSALKNAGHPYWYFDSSNPANKGIKITNAVNGAHGLSMPTNASVTTNSPVPCPSGKYTYSMQIYVPPGSDGKINVQFSGTSLINNAQLPKISKDFTGLQAGKVNTIQFTIDESEFQSVPPGTFFRPSVSITNSGGPITIFNTQLTSQDSSIYDQINSINPYNQRNTWDTPTKYDFTQGPISRDWGVALTGNTMFSPGSPASEYTKQTNQGIQINSNRDNTNSPPFSNGGIQSTQLLPSGKDFNISMQFTATTQDPSYEPTLALWTYGESQGGPDSPLYHTNGPGADAITEFDCEMGSDPSPNTPPDKGSIYARDGSYIGDAEGGHSEYIDTKDGIPNWKKLPDFWDGKEHTLSMEGHYNAEGHLILTRTLDGKVFSTQDVGPGPFSPMYIKVALENPNWNSRGKNNGTAHVTIQNMSVNTSSPTGLNPGVTLPTIPVKDVDYTWFTPGGGGSPSYTPFPSSSPPPSFHTPTSTQDLENELTQFGASGDQNVKALVAVVLSEVKSLAGKDLSLTSIESWAYAAMIGKMTANSEYSTGLANLTPSEQTLFKTLSGMDQFQGNLSSHSFSTADVTSIAKSFSDGTINLQNPNDTKFIQTFYANLQAGQNPQTAVNNAYKQVPPSLISQGMQTLVTGLIPTPLPPHTPTNIEDLENQLTQFGASGDQNVKALASVVMSEVKDLANKGLSLTSIESWAYSAMIGKMTANSEYSTGLANLTPSEQTLFKTLSGMDQFQGNLSSHSFSTADVSAIAKSFSDGTINLQNPNDTKFMQTFYANLQAGQNPKTAAQNAYTTVPPSSVSQALQTFVTGIVNPNPPPFTPHTPTSIQDLENQLNQFAASGNTNVKALASVVMSEVKDLANKGLSLTSIESWAYAAIVGQFTKNSEYSIGFQNIGSSNQALFKTLSGIDQFQGNLSSRSFSTADVSAIAKTLSDGTISLKTPDALAFMQAFYSNLNSGQDPQTAATNAYAKVPASKLSSEMNGFIQELSRYSPPQPGGKEQGYFDYTKIDSFIWSGSYNGEKFITYPESHQWKATLNVNVYKEYLASVFQRMKEVGMGQVDIDFAQIGSIDALLSGDYSKAPGTDPLIKVLKNEKFLGPDGNFVDMFNLFINEAHVAGLKVDLSFGGENASEMKICGTGETVKGQADKLAAFMQKYQINSVDFDLEETGASNFASQNTIEEQRGFFQELHNQLAPQGKTVLLTLEGSTKWANTLRALFYDDQKTPIFGNMFDGLNLMLYSQTQYYIDANNQDWGIEQWLNIIGKQNAEKIHIGFEDLVPYESQKASAGEKYEVDPNSRGKSAAKIYLQLMENLKKDGYPSELGAPFWWPDEGLDTYDPNNQYSIISKTMGDFYQYLKDHS